jgi:tetratricopeptide (TPR) repeat protein
MIEVLAFLASGFWMLMIFDCVRNDSDRNTWLWILIFLNVPGAILYFLVRRAPYMNFPVPLTFQRWSRRHELWNAEAAARNIGNAHQFINLGNILYDMRLLDRAADAYQKALEKEPANTHGLWGISTIQMQRKQSENAKDHLEALLKLEPNYKFGEASLAYGQVLFELQDWEAAQDYLEQDIKNWGHPESYIMLATIRAKQGEIEAARGYLETMLFKVRGSPVFHYRQKQHLVRRAEGLLKTLRR